MKNQSMIVGCLVSAVVVGGASFYGGIQYQKSKMSSAFGGRGAGRNMPQGSNRPVGMMGGRGGSVTGDVSAKDDKSLTVKMPDGSSRNVILSGSTLYRLSTEATLEKVSVGSKIMVNGTPNSDGSVTATQVIVN